MYDKFHLEIPFKSSVVRHLSCSTPENPVCFVDFKRYSFPKFSPQIDIVNGNPVISRIESVKWNSISSGISGMAVGFFPEGEGFSTYPSISLKASPAKILQGHNVFGSESPHEGIKQMLINLNLAFPDIYKDLDIQNSHIRYIDSTYSARIRDFFSEKVFRIFESLATKRQKVSKDHGYIQLGAGSDRQRQKLYRKLQELLDDLKASKKSHNQFRTAILSDPRLLVFATDLHRFEATTGHRKFAELSIPTRLPEFLKFNDWFLSVHKIPLCRYLWESAFNPLFAQFEGHTVKNVDDDNIEILIEKHYTVIKNNGKICKRKANAIFNTYKDIKRDGYNKLLKRGNQTFFRNVKYLEQIGISRAFLKSLDPFKPDENVIPMVQIIKIDFSSQRPDWYVEPKAGISLDQPERQLRLVG